MGYLVAWEVLLTAWYRSTGVMSARVLEFSWTSLIVWLSTIHVHSVDWSSVATRDSIL